MPEKNPIMVPMVLEIKHGQHHQVALLGTSFQANQQLLCKNSSAFGERYLNQTFFFFLELP